MPARMPCCSFNRRLQRAVLPKYLCARHFAPSFSGLAADGGLIYLGDSLAIICSGPLATQKESAYERRI